MSNQVLPLPNSIPLTVILRKATRLTAPLLFVTLLEGCFFSSNAPPKSVEISPAPKEKLIIKEKERATKFYQLKQNEKSLNTKFTPKPLIREKPSKKKSPWAASLNGNKKRPPFVTMKKLSTKLLLQEAKAECENIGFNPKTTDYAKCVMRLMR